MKILISFLAAMLLIVAGCKSGAEGDPKEVLGKFFDALTKRNIDEAKKYVTKDSEGMMGMVQMGMQSAGDKANEMANYEKENIELGSAVINGDKATVPVKDKKSGETTDFTLKNEGGAWKVAFDKSTLMEMAQKKMKEHGMGGMPNGLGDSLRNINHGSMPDMDSISHEDMKDAQKILDSVNK